MLTFLTTIENVLILLIKLRNSNLSKMDSHCKQIQSLPAHTDIGPFQIQSLPAHTDIGPFKWVSQIIW
jgi:hypothetical protein